MTVFIDKRFRRCQTGDQMKILFASLLVIFQISSIVESRTFTDCGKSDIAPRLRKIKIVGGQIVQRYTVPWQVSVQRKSGRDFWSHWCGGTILTPLHVLTAAHCINNPNKINEYRAIVAEHDLSKEEVHEKIHYIACIKNHPEYALHHANDNDFSMMTMMNPIDLGPSSLARAVCLPEKSHYQKLMFVEGFTKFKTSGWGAMSYGGPSPNILNEVTVNFVTQKRCAGMYSQIIHITENMICAGDIEQGGKDACQGDSGGPLTWYDPKSKTQRIVGVVSFGEGCGMRAYPGVFAKVTAQLDWIMAQGVEREKNMCRGYSQSSENGLPSPPGPASPESSWPWYDPSSENGPASPESSWPWYDPSSEIGPASPESSWPWYDPSSENGPASPESSWPWYDPSYEYGLPSWPSRQNQCNLDTVNDGYCDDENNVAECFFDGKDCCKSSLKRWGWDSHCKECKCKEPDTCQHGRNYVGDGFCDDMYNTPYCNYDGGDCCLRRGKYWDAECKSCQCIRP